ncbi:MAG: hypothetical protein JO103_02870 [Candidatus Eremiobacteraeota bacterium]|nr:hypothetical protein [Candidatus Eremiobacteraeota bacterium]MBV9407214.1 hypothetical protein [Candidatus Eremiobacteraeota bacterium]
MTIMATHFAIVLGAWRLRVRIDLDEPREEELSEAPRRTTAAAPSAEPQPRVATWGRG